jgi:hypothetical protein
VALPAGEFLALQEIFPTETAAFLVEISPEDAARAGLRTARPSTFSRGAAS